MPTNTSVNNSANANSLMQQAGQAISNDSTGNQAMDDGSLPRGIPVWAVVANASFARPGPRLVDGVEALAGILHPGVAQPPDPTMARQLR